MRIIIILLLFVLGLIISFSFIMSREPENGTFLDNTSSACNRFSNVEKERAFNEFIEGYADYKKNFITSDGAGANNEFLRVRMPDSWTEPVPDKSTSESIGYGMVFAVHANDRQTFDGLWNYAKSHFIEGLMHWNIGPDNEWIVGAGESAGPASDADIDMGYALIAADQKWGGYRDDAKALIDNIMLQQVEHENYVIKLSPIWGGSNLTSPDRFDPTSFLIFAEFTEDVRWENVAITSGAIIQRFLESNEDAVLLPEWLNIEGEAISDPGLIPMHGYDASRYRVRLAKVFRYDCSPVALELFKRENAFYEKNVKNPEEIVDGYSIIGEPRGEYRGVNSFVSGVFMTSMVSENEEYRKSVADYTKKLSTTDNSYFSQSVYLYSKLVASEKMLMPSEVKQYTR